MKRHWDALIQRKSHMRTRQEGSHLQAKEKRPQMKLNLLTPLSWNSGLQNWKKIHHYCLSLSPSLRFCYGSPSKLIHTMQQEDHTIRPPSTVLELGSTVFFSMDKTISDTQTLVSRSGKTRDSTPETHIQSQTPPAAQVPPQKYSASHTTSGRTARSPFCQSATLHSTSADWY